MSQEFNPAALLYSSRKHVLSNKKLKKSHCWLPALMKFVAGWRGLTRVQWHCRKSESFTGSLIGAYCKSITKIQMSCWWSFIHFSDYKCNILWTVCYAKQIHVFSSTLKSYFCKHQTSHKTFQFCNSVCNTHFQNQKTNQTTGSGTFVLFWKDTVHFFWWD